MASEKLSDDVAARLRSGFIDPKSDALVTRVRELEQALEEARAELAKERQLVVDIQASADAGFAQATAERDAARLAALRECVKSVNYLSGTMAAQGIQALIDAEESKVGK